MNRADLAWIAVLAAGAALQARALRWHDVATVCQLVRRTFRTDTAVGRAAFIAARLAFAHWYGRHVSGGPAMTRHSSSTDLSAFMAAMGDRTGVGLARALARLDVPKLCRLCRQRCTVTIQPKGTNPGVYVCASCAQDIPIELLSGSDVEPPFGEDA